MKVEYLIILKKEESFCNSKEAFKKFLGVDSSINFEDKSLVYKFDNKNLVVSYKLKTGVLEQKNERYFLLEMISDNLDEVRLYSSLCRLVKKIVYRINPTKTNVNTLWDDIGIYYATQAYPIINNVENLMRKLITRFMLVNVGMDWASTAMHSEIKQKIDNKVKKSDSFHDELYGTDFIQLSEVLFKKYRNLNQNQLDGLISKSIKIENLELEELKKSLPRSNWERYFSNLIHLDEEKLKNNWKLLYDIRNDIAHNRYISLASYEKIKNLSTAIEKPLNDAIKSLDKIHVELEDKIISTENYLIASRSMRLVKVAKDLNVGVSTIVNFLKSEGYEVPNKPSTKLTEEMLDTLYKEYAINQKEKEEADRMEIGGKLR
jgi:hypothetical protein